MSIRGTSSARPWALNNSLYTKQITDLLNVDFHKLKYYFKQESGVLFITDTEKNLCLFTHDFLEEKNIFSYFIENNFTNIVFQNLKMFYNKVFGS